MKRITFISLISLCILAVGCQSNELDDIATKSNIKVQLSPEELLSLQYESSPELSQTEMFNLLRAFHDNEMEANTKSHSSFQPSSFQIKNKYYLDKDNTHKGNLHTKSISDTENIIPIYEIGIISGENNGIAIVSGDRRAPHIIAYIDRIKDNDTIAAGPNALIQWGEMYIQNEVNRFDEARDSLYKSASSKISKELNIPISDIQYKNIKNRISTETPISRSKPIDEVPSNLKLLVGILPMCPVKWGQWEPYNCMLPKGNCEKFFPGYVENTNYPAGAGAVTIAHLMTCIEPNRRVLGLGIDWRYLTENKEIKAPDYFNAGDPIAKREMVGNLFKLIYDKTKSHTVANSNGVVTGSTCTVSDIENYIKSIFSCSGRKSWNINTIKNSIKARQPVYVYGKPDNKPSAGIYPFILDGLKECHGRIDNVPYDIDVNYIHANFGFGNGYQDGYYLMDIEKTTITFETTVPLIFKDQALTMIANIKLK
ncbi:C10 family peptidase [uncultured Bacteroides sp.]|uniref:C10 family peptidase n=1 Tax=uncultured Bacteroides sp. TaxID=162156 RepID=UPI0027295E55|nr:C10 family peptidase [uncultured Bacteroides sp.]